LYKNVPRSAAIRKLVFEQYVRFLPAEEYEKKSELFRKEFLLDYVIRDKRLQEKKQAELDPFRDRAEFKRRFHVPEDGNDSMRKETASDFALPDGAGFDEH
jgi:hypothetical protein